MKSTTLVANAGSAFVWLGPVLVLAGWLVPDASRQWHPGRAGELLLIALLALGVGHGLSSRARLPLATVLVLVWFALLMLFAGPLPVLATCLFALACIALGGAICAQAPLPLQGLTGAVVMAGVLGWLLQVPVHYAWAHVLVCLGLVLVRRQALAGAVRGAIQHWQAAVREAPRLSASVVIVLGLAATACWLPTVQFDDLAYHLGLPWQLQADAVYRPDPRVQVWSLAPWATDIVQAVPQVMLGHEARGPVNFAWLAVLACGVWQLSRRLEASASAAWWSVGLVASLPMTAALAAGMQTELPSAAALVWLAVLVAAPAGDGFRFWLPVVILAAGLVAMKLVAAAMAGLLVSWALVRHPWPGPKRILALLGIGLVLSSSSYAMSYLQTGNPVLPLFNGWFGSPFFAQSNSIDQRWQAGFDAALPWNLTFHTSRYGEVFDGGGGFVLVALAGAWLFAFAQRDLRGIALVASAALVLPLIPVQYLRYAYPGLVLLIPVLVVAAARAAPSSWRWLVAGLVVVNLGFQANSHWMLRTGIAKQTVLALGRDGDVFEKYAPERLLAVMIRDQGPEQRKVLFFSPAQPFFAELGQRGVSSAWYSPDIEAAAVVANLDDSGRAWEKLLASERIGEIILRRANIAPAQEQALARMQASRRAVVGDAEWWTLPR